MPIKKTEKTKIIKKENTKLPLSGNLFERNRKRISSFKLLRLIFVFSSSFFIIFIILYSIINSNRSNAESITQDKIISQLSKTINLPNEGLISVMRVSDAKSLSIQDNLYKNVKNGDYIIVYKSMILVYDFDSRFIKDIKTINP
jgi:hypothetical protein